MPINDPIRERKVAPESLAFDPNAQRGGSTVTYQQGLQTAVTNTTIILQASKRDLEQAKQGTMIGVANAEKRAKHWVGDYMTVLDWDIIQSHTLWLNSWHPIPYEHEVIRAHGARYDTRRTYGGAGDPGFAHWYHTVLKGHEGVWWYYARLSITFTTLMAVTGAKLGIFVNNILYSVIAEMDADMSGDGALILDCIMQGGRHIPLNAGDVVDIRLHTAGPVSGSDTFSNPTSLGGYVTAHRERCSTTIISSPGTGYGFVFQV